jgi:enoyl-CoA hydratase/carnithine racemase
MTDHVTTEQDQGVLIVRLNRAAKKNALTGEMYTVMADAIERAAADRAIKTLLYTGSDGVFTAGNDLHDFLNNPPTSPQSPVNRFIANMVSTDVPIVAAVDGVAVGIGTTMLLHFDQVFATDRARFSLPFINLGLVPEAGSSMLLVESCGYRKAAELLMLGEPFTAQQALEYGIVSRLCAPDELMERALAAAHSLASKPRDALRATKRLLRRPAEPLSQRVVAEGELFSRALESSTAQEAMSAFFEKRAPNFKQFD